MKFSLTILTSLLSFNLIVPAANALERLRVREATNGICGTDILFRDLFIEIPQALEKCFEGDVGLDLSWRSNQVILTREQLAKIIRPKINACTEHFELIIPEQVIFSSVARYTHGQADSYVRNQIQALFPQSEVEIVRINVPQIECRQGKMVREGSISIEGRNSFKIPLQGAGRTFWLTGEYRIFKQIPVALRLINTGERIFKDDFQMQKRDVTYQADVVTKTEDIEGKALRRGVMPGQPVSRSDIQREFLIDKGQLVRVRAGSESFEITGTAVAEQAGYMGDIIRLKNPETQKLISGTVVSKGIVELN